MMVTALAPSRYLDLNLRSTGWIYMTQWARKNLDELGRAVQKEVMATSQSNTAMFDLHLLSQKIELSMSEPERNLAIFRGTMCALCRQNKMYKCDVDVGWSLNCAFVRHHAG